MNSRTKGIFHILLAGLAFAFMGLFIRLSGDLPAIQKSFFRNLIAFAVTFSIFIKNGEKIQIKKENYKFLILRSTFGTIGIICNFYALDHMVLSDASMLNKLSPFFVIIFSYFILKERITIFQGLMVLTAFLGAVFIVKPTGNISSFPAIIAALGGMGAGAAYTMVRLLGKRGVEKKIIIMFFSGFSCIASIPFMLGRFAPMSLNQLLLLICAGIMATVGQFAITKAYFYAPAKEISIYDYSQIIFSALIGFAFLQQIPDLHSVLGYVIICFSAVSMYLYNSRHVEA
ncbi:MULTISPECIES: DMT family transporter [unclassified Sedimentibacter]|uniref:DMT family transporter n=1 Tax=unclassified Sedimentibacter TaxID=2649220 RepID=UPI0027DEE123|nr:DMT family transporter [Sedimentibacter sp. MB35-C1]WMJ77460.1 DMT family transporter [Sedimentibacter sp. MB35-C1]